MIPRPLKFAFAIATVIWTAVHLRWYPPATMLWFCAFGNVLIAIGLAMESRLLLSMQAIALVIPQTIWTLDAAWRVASGARGGGTSYLFDESLPLAVRLLSLFHVLVPPLLLYALSRLGYDPRALRLQLVTGTIVLLASFSAGALNVNGVYAPLAGRDALPPLVHLLAALIVWTAVCWIPAAIVLRTKFSVPPQRRLLPFLLVLTIAACAHRGAHRVITVPQSNDAAVSELMRTVSVDEFEPATFTAHDGTSMPYRVLRPQHLEPNRTYPLVVIFHGSGAIGTDNVSQIGPVAKSWATPAMRERWPAFILVPQFADRSAVYSNGTSTATNLLHAALELVDEQVRTLPVDRKRIVTVGFSMGGSAVWNAIALRPELFSAAIAVAGVPNPDALRRTRTRLLLVHGDADVENPYSDALRAYEQARNGRVEFWQYRGLAHEYPRDLITGTTVADWLLKR